MKVGMRDGKLIGTPPPEETPREPFRRARKMFVPMAEGVVIQLDERTQDEAGIVIPKGMKDPRGAPTATVIAVGAECKYVKEGDIVVLGNQGLMAVDFEGEPQVLVTVEIHLAGILLDEGYYARRNLEAPK